LSGAQDPEHIKEMFAGFGPVAVRRMFRGAGIFADGLMIAIAVDGAIYLKADEQTFPRFEREGLKPFSYKTRDGRRSIKSLRRMPERLHDDPDELAGWAKRALEAARRSSARHRNKPVRMQATTKRSR
jgi:DNA transformation protein